MKTLALILAIAAYCAGAYITFKDMTKPAPDPFAKCIPLPSSDKANYWRCEK